MPVPTTRRDRTSGSGVSSQDGPDGAVDVVLVRSPAADRDPHRCSPPPHGGAWMAGPLPLNLGDDLTRMTVVVPARRVEANNNLIEFLVHDLDAIGDLKQARESLRHEAAPV